MRGSTPTRLYLLAGVLAILASPILPLMAQQVVYVVLGVGSGVAVVVGMRRHRPSRRLPWRLLLGAIVVTQIYTVIVTVKGLHPSGTPFPQFEDWFFLLAYPLMIAALVTVTGPGRHVARSTVMVDAAIITCTAAVLTWCLLVGDFLARQRMSPAALTVALAYPVFDLFMAATVTRMAVLGGRRNAAHLLLMVGALATLAADIGYVNQLTPTAPGPSNPLSVAGWMLGYLCLSAAALHPAMARMGAAPGVHRASGRGRIARYALLVVVGPAVTAIDLITDRGMVRPLDVLLPLALTAAIGVLLVLRAGQLADVAQRRAADLNARTAELEAALDSQATLQHQLAHRALHDALTGLPNRVLLRERLDQAVARSGRHALLMLDLDGFKDVNDTLGHPVGDELLTVAAGRLAGVLARTDTLARLGGDEFAVLLEDVTAEQANAVAARVLDAVREPFAVAGHRLHVTASIGLLYLDVEHTGGADAFRDADLALYAAKAAGKDRVVVYHDTLREEHLRRTQMVERLRHALDHHELDLHYQPVVDLRTRAVVSVEALLRWFPPDGPPIRPDQFIPVAESSGLILPIGAWVLRRACEEAKQWYDRHGIRISVNVSAEQLRDAAFPAQVEAALKAASLSARALTLEVTESMLVDPTNGDAQRAVAHLTHLRALGVQVALDDFGTGYSSLAYLRDLPVDSLKIDRAFMPTAGSPERAQLTRAVVDLGASLGLVTVAEGVETAEQATQLAELACDLGQGYHFARPLPAAELTAYVTAAAARPHLPTAA
jgi:diguanylate cyclase (GGDEF)-like protein